MLDRDRIAALIPHQGRMCLLDQVVSWDETMILCRTSTHLDPANPLRRAGRLGALAGIEYGMQAAALHGALHAGRAQAPGYLAAVRDVTITAARLDEPAPGALSVTARLELRQEGGLIYGFTVAAEGGGALVSGRAGIMIPPVR